MKFWKLALIAVVGLGLSACASKIKSDVARFHKGPDLAPGSFAIVPRDPAKVGSLEFEQYASLVRGELVKLGFTPVNAANASDYVLEMEYGISDGETVVKSRPSVFYGYYGYYGRHSLFYHGAYSPYAYGGYGGYGGSDTYSYTVFTRELTLNMMKSPAADRKVVFEGRVNSVGRDNRLPEIMPYLVQAMFTNFPGESGVTKRVVIELPDKRGTQY